MKTVLVSISEEVVIIGMLLASELYKIFLQLSHMEGNVLADETNAELCSCFSSPFFFSTVQFCRGFQLWPKAIFFK